MARNTNYGDSNPNDGTPGGSGHVFGMDPGRMETFAAEHDDIGEQARVWAASNLDLPERVLESHGKVAYNTVLGLREAVANKLAAGMAFADRNGRTADTLRRTVVGIQATDEGSAADLGTDTRA
ncbi:type VII secretion target [Mycolicibacterium sp. XJ870]